MIVFPRPEYVRAGQGAPTYDHDGEYYDPVSLEQLPAMRAPSGSVIMGVPFSPKFGWEGKPVLMLASYAGVVIDVTNHGDIRVAGVGSTRSPASRMYSYVPLTIPMIGEDGKLVSNPTQPYLSREMKDLLKEITKFGFTLNEFLGRADVERGENRIKYDDIRDAFDNGRVVEHEIVPKFSDKGSYGRTNVVFKYTDREGKQYGTLVKYNPVTGEVSVPMKK